MKAVLVGGDAWVVYDDATRFAVAVQLKALAEREAALASEAAQLDITGDDVRLLEWARSVGYAQSWEGQHLAEVTYERDQAREWLRAIVEAGGVV